MKISKHFFASHMAAVITTTALSIGLTVISNASAETALTEVLAQRSEQEQARDDARHPLETLNFFGVKPGMVVAEALPGGGWYTKILANYLGAHSTLYGVNYIDEMWPMFGFFDQAGIDKVLASTPAFPQTVAGFTDNGIAAQGFTFGTVPEDKKGTVDVFLLVRALHNLNRFEQQAGTYSQAMAAIYALVKPGGTVGVVQHRAPESVDDSWADGSRGYLKQSFVIDSFEAAGFELVDSSNINANPKDQPGAEDVVWRLPPTLMDSKSDEKRRAAMLAIGESNRMTLKFSKPADRK